MRFIRNIFAAISDFSDLKVRLKRFEKADPIMTRLNLMAMHLIFESLPNVSAGRIALGAFASLLLRIVFLPFAFLRSWWKWILWVIFIGSIYALAPEFFQRHSVAIALASLAVVFRNAVFLGVPRAVFLIAEMLSGGRLMRSIGLGYLKGTEISQRLMNPWGPVFSLLPIYAEMLNSPDAERYRDLMKVFLQYTDTRDSSEFLSMEQRFWAKRIQ
jgi:hypothetical protein